MLVFFKVCWILPKRCYFLCSLTMREYMIEPGKLSESNSSGIFTLELFGFYPWEIRPTNSVLFSLERSVCERLVQLTIYC